MTLLFKATDPQDVDHPIVGDTNFKKHNPSVNLSMSWDTLEPFIRQATEHNILDFVGEDFYNEIALMYDAGTTSSASEERVLKYFQDAIAWYTGVIAMESLNVTMADMGIQQNSSKEGVSNPTTQWAFKAALKNALKNADLALDRLLSYLEKHVDEFQTWKNSDAYNVKTSNFLRRTADVDDILNIKNSRRSFVALSSWMKRAEEQHLLPIIEQTTFDTFSTKVKEGTLTNDIEKKFVKIARDLVAFKGLANAVDHLAISVEDEGFRVVSHTDGFEDRRNASSAQHLKLQAALKMSAEKNAKEAEACLIAFLYKNKDSFPDWVASDAYQTMVKRNSTKVLSSPNRRGAIFL